MFKNITSRWRRAAVAVTAVAVVLGLGVGAAVAAGDQQLGIDVSKWQHKTSIDWAAVQADGIEFAFIKATEGSTYTNAYFAPDWADTGALGIYHGAYHFARPSLGSAAKQATYFAGVIGDQHAPGDLPPVLDLEVTGGLTVAQLRTWVSNWLATTETLTGRTPMIYVSPSFWETNMGDSTAYTHYPLWIAHYGVSSPRVPGGWSTWTFWQGRSDGTVTGISGSVDMDAFNGTLAGLQRMANVVPATGTPTPSDSASPTVTPTPTDTPTVTPTDTATTTPTLTTTPSDTPTTAPAPSDPPTPVQRAASTLTLRTTRSVVHGRQSLLLRGRLTSGRTQLGGRPVRVFRKRPGARAWTLVRPVTTAADGTLQLSVRPISTMVYRAVFAGGPQYRRVVSAWWRVTVRR